MRAASYSGRAVALRLVKVEELASTPHEGPRQRAASASTAGPQIGGFFKKLFGKKKPNGGLKPDELEDLQKISDDLDADIDVIGSRARGEGRNVETDLPVGKGPGTRSDIDVRIDGQIDIDTRGQLSGRISEVGNGAGSVASSTGLPSAPPVIKIRPGKPPVHEN